jgi:hypothetical protein
MENELSKCYGGKGTEDGAPHSLRTVSLGTFGFLSPPLETLRKSKNLNSIIVIRPYHNTVLK